MVQASTDLDSDIAVLKKRLKKAEAENHYFHYIINRLPVSIYWKDREGRYLGCNQYVANMAGLNDANAIIGKTDAMLPWADYAVSLNDIDTRVLEKGIVEEIEENPTLSTGNDHYFLTTKGPLCDENNHIVGVMGVSVDITERKKMEHDLIQAKEKAEAANRAKTTFLANMSHDVKTPLTGVVSMADVMVHDTASREVDRERANIIFSSGQQIVSLFNSCLDLSKMEMEEWASKKEVFSIKQLLNDIHDLFLPKAISNHLLFNLEYDESLPDAVEGHRESLYRVLLNLVGNAIKFTEQGSVILRAFKKFQQADDEHAIVEFQVQDTGMGIPEDKYQVIFEKLHRLTPSYASKIEGSGMGLYIVDQYVKRLGGDIQVKSKVGEGSTFIVSLPLALVTNTALSETKMPPSNKTPVKSEDKPAAANLEQQVSAESSHGKILARVLLVEDTQMIQVVTKSLLNSAGFEVDIANSGEEALEMFVPEKYSLIYMDIGLPVMNGYETAKAIREKEKTLNATTLIPIIALTGHGAVDVQAFCSEAGMQGVLSKPLSKEQAEKIWQHYGKQESTYVPGLTVLENDQPVAPENNILDISATAKIVGSKEVANKLIAEFVKDLENQFLPNIKVLIAEHKNDELKFLLHQKLGSLAYVKAPVLEKKLSDLQTTIYNGSDLPEDTYKDIEQEVLRVVKLAKKL